MNHQYRQPATSLYTTPTPLVTPLRVVLVAPPKVPGWVRVLLDMAAGSDWIDLVVETAPDATLPTVHGVSADLRAFLAYERAVFRRADRSLQLETVPPCHAAHTATEPDASAPLHARVGALRPDLVLLLGPVDWAPALATQAPWGCWKIAPGLTDPLYAGIPLLTPIIQGKTATKMELVLQGPTRGPISMADSWGRTRAATFLIQREDAFLKLAALVLRALHGVAAGQVHAARRSVSTLDLRSPDSPTTKAIGVRVMLATLRATARSITRRFRDDPGWTLLLRDGGSLLHPGVPVMGSHVMLKASRGWWADPCVVAADGRTLVFVEEMADLSINKGTIACVELVDGGARRLGTVLDEPGHLSFPQPFQWEGQWYLTVESSYARRVGLYRATNFPLEWDRIRDLITGRVCVDPTLHHHEGRWYLFANVAENGNSTWDELFLFVADSLEGPFLPHPANPIVGDVRRARMAGKLFHHEGRLIRPAQDCAPRYGSAVVFNEVLELGPDVYRERECSRLGPDWASRLHGCHTYSVAGGVEVLDVRGRPAADAHYVRVSGDRAASAPAWRAHRQQNSDRRSAVARRPPRAPYVWVNRMGDAKTFPGDVAGQDE